jgi:calpain-15
VGLLHTHIYSILDVREFENFGKPIRLLKLRNPWGHKEWKGDWSNGWALWPNHIKSQVSVYHNNDGNTINKKSISFLLNKLIRPLFFL